MITVAHVQIGQFITHSKFNRGNKVVSIIFEVMDTTLASIFAGVYDGHAESLTHFLPSA
ncbi:MAG: hypothetical protein VB142_12445 [Burkholderia sp.]